jgi:hypothetical protein
MVQKEKVILKLFLVVMFLVLPCVVAENVIYGDPLPETDRLNNIVITSDNFYYDTMSYIYVNSYTSNNSIVNLDSLTIEPYNYSKYVDYTSSAVSQDITLKYKRGFSFKENEDKEITFKITAVKGDKTITQDYKVSISEFKETSTFKDKTIASLNFLYEGIVNNGWIFLGAFLIIFMVIFIIKGVGYLMK